MDIEVSFPGGKRVDAQVGDFVVRTDQPADAGGDGSAPAPFDLFLASLATCAGIYVVGFCQARGIPTDGIRLVQRVENDVATKRPRRITVEVHVPAGFPPQYRDAVANAAAACKVKKVLADPPAFEVKTVAEPLRDVA
jgi:ribosomal protein S12 methylthiotransferase accessory factor